MKSDSLLKKDVIAELAWDPAINATGVGVAVKDGVVTVSGHLDSFVEKRALERAVRRVYGVQAIAIEANVQLTGPHQRSDTEIATAAEQALRLHTWKLADKVKLIVEHGWVSLQGEVDWRFQRDEIEKAIRPLAGVVGIRNNITLKAKPVPSDVSSRIGEALKRQAQREAAGIEVTVDGDLVRLKGKVHSWSEFDAVSGAAWGAPGVRTVMNDLRVDT